MPVQRMYIAQVIKLEGGGKRECEILGSLTWFASTKTLSPGVPFVIRWKYRTPGQAQQHSSFEWLCKHNRLRPEPIRFVRLDSEHAQSDGKSVNRGLPKLDMARGRNPRR